MFPIKRFVQGPSLHEETVTYEENAGHGLNNNGTLNGDEASQAYVEIISLPSTANEDVSTKLSTVSASTSVVSRSRRKIPKQKDSDNHQVPKLSSLMTYCESNKHELLMEKLEKFRNELNINAVDEYGWTLLMSASCAGSVECISVLLQHGADWNIRDKKGLSAMSVARKNRQDAVCQMLEKWNNDYLRQQKNHDDDEDSDVQIIEGEGETPSYYCESCKIHYSSSRETHEKSIAHLNSTRQFGDDKIHFGIPESNVGFQLMVKSGWNKSTGLGPDGKGHKFPVKTILKRDKLGLGNEKAKKSARITHFGPFDRAAVEGTPERIERAITTHRREATRTKNRERRKEINFRREFSSL